MFARTMCTKVQKDRYREGFASVTVSNDFVPSLWSQYKVQFLAGMYDFIQTSLIQKDLEFSSWGSKVSRNCWHRDLDLDLL